MMLLVEGIVRILGGLLLLILIAGLTAAAPPRLADRPPAPGIEQPVKVPDVIERKPRERLRTKPPARSAGG